MVRTSVLLLALALPAAAGAQVPHPPAGAKTPAAGPKTTAGDQTALQQKIAQAREALKALQAQVDDAAKQKIAWNGKAGDALGLKPQPGGDPKAPTKGSAATDGFRPIFVPPGKQNEEIVRGMRRETLKLNDLAGELGKGGADVADYQAALDELANAGDVGAAKAALTKANAALQAAEAKLAGKP
jgi:hypothetical protein